MTAVRDLHDLCRQMTPSIADGVFVYCTFSDFRLPHGLEPICTFRESEGLTAIVGKSQAEAAGVPYTFPCRLITLAVHSSLDAVGFLACITDRLAQAGIACNAVAASTTTTSLCPRLARQRPWTYSTAWPLRPASSDIHKVVQRSERTSFSGADAAANLRNSAPMR